MKRIGPHNIDVVSILVALLLGDGWCEKRGMSIRIHFHISSCNAEYLYWLHNFFTERGYCSRLRPKLSYQIGKNNSTYFSLKFRTWSYSSFYFLYDLFYEDRGVKHIKSELIKYLNAQVLAIMFMNNGNKTGQTIHISSNCFSYDEQLLLCRFLFLKFNLNFNVHKKEHRFCIYLETSDYSKFESIVTPYVIKSLRYKLL